MKSALLVLATLTLCISQNFSQAIGDFQSAGTGTWATPSTWQTWNGSAWVPAGAAPTSASGAITILNTHIVTVAAAVSVDQVTINTGGTVRWTTGALTIADGTGTDLIVNGTFIDESTSNAVFGGGTARWQLGANGTYIKRRAGSAAVWRDNYQGGMATIPATSNWIIQKTLATNPVLTTVGGSYYGNLTIENQFGGTWGTSAGSTFQGAADFPRIKGNLDIGGTAGLGMVVFLNQHTNVNPTLISGDMIVRAGSTFQNYGTGIEIQGNFTNNGIVSYDGNDGRRIVFSGGNPQFLTNTGVLGIYDLTMNKSANTLTLNSPITINNLATFTSGIINNSIANLVVLTPTATVTGASNASFVNGPVRKFGGAGLTFPIGKNISYRPLILGNGIGTAPFWTEDFGTATCAARGTLANGFVSANGTWTQTDGSNGSAANEWYVSPTEANMGQGVCGDGCVNNGALTNSTLHLSAIGGLCGSPDCGSAYDATDATNITDKRVESPTINCTGQSSITLNFLAITNGEGTNDLLTIWYFDGSTWSLLVDPATSGLCGALCGFGICQGVWSNYSINLPASADNNPNVRIGFRWVNDGNGAGSDPSAGIDDISLISSNNSIFTAEYFPANPQIPYGNILAPTLTALSDCEYWILDRNAGTEARVVGLTWNAATCYNTAFASFEVARYDGISTWQDHDGIVTGTAAGGIVTTPLPVPNFSPLAIAYVPLPLPVEMINISADCEEGTGVIEWQTASEINNDHFSIERSADALNWIEMGRVTGNGNSNVFRSYSWVDTDPLENGYYRIKQFDYDGQYKTYDPISLTCISQQNWITVYPNPTNGTINIEVSSGSMLEAVQVYSSLGQFVSNLITNEVKGKSTFPVNISFLEPGTYYLRLLVNGNWITKPVVLIK